MSKKITPPANIEVRRILFTDLTQFLKKQREFLKWMGRRHQEINPDQSAAFFTGAQLLDEIREDLLAGLFDLDPEAKPELFTRAELEELQ